MVGVWAGLSLSGYGSTSPGSHTQPLVSPSGEAHCGPGQSCHKWTILQIQDSINSAIEWFTSSEKAGPEGETGCVDDGLQVVVGGDQLCRGALAILRLYREGLSENHRQRRFS